MVLATLTALVRRPLAAPRTPRWPGVPTLTARLVAMAQGFGGKDEVRRTHKCMLKRRMCTLPTPPTALV